MYGLDSTRRYKNSCSYNRFSLHKFIGDRTIQEKDFGKIQKDRVSEMKSWSRFLKRAREEHRKINLAIVAANNHYAGFGPGLLTLLEKCWICQKGHGIMLKCHRQKQKHYLKIQSKLVYQIFWDKALMNYQIIFL